MARIGWDMNGVRVEVSVEGMTCAHCQRAVQNAIAALPGVNEVHVDLRANKAIVHGRVEEEALIRAIRNEGYEAHLTQDSQSKV
jgi:copper chaperone